MRVIGLTGGLASGKSTVSSYLKEKGAEILDADLIARELMAPGQPAWLEVVRYFGRDVLNEDGSINRQVLAERVFTRSEDLALLNAITHPLVRQEIVRRLNELNNRPIPPPVAVVDAPLLIEAGLTDLVEEVWLVAVEPKIQIERAVARGMAAEEAQRRLAAQWPLDKKMVYATRVIDNNGSREEMKKQVDELWLQLL